MGGGEGVTLRVVSGGLLVRAGGGLDGGEGVDCYVEIRGRCDVM